MGVCRTLLLLPALLIGLRAAAQQYGFVAYTTEDGLAQSQVRTIAEDAEGFLWFGTLGGASRFDGDHFVNYALREGLPDPQVNMLHAAANGILWMACGSGLAYATGRSVHTEHLPMPWAGRRVLSLASGADGNLYMATDGAGVARRTAEGWSLLPGYPLEEHPSARVLHVLPDGDLLIGLRSGMLRYGRNGATMVPGTEGMAISGIDHAADGSIWLSTYGSGVLQLGPSGSLRAYTMADGLMEMNFRSILVDDQQRVWAASKVGVVRITHGKVKELSVEQGLPGENIWSLHQDRAGNIWMGSDGAGVYRFAGERFVNYTMRDGLCSDQVMAVVQDAAGAIWLGTYGQGICRLDGSGRITTANGLPNNTVWSACRGSGDRLYFGTSDGLVLVENGRTVPLKPEKALRGERILSLYKDRKGRLWCGTRDRIIVFAADGGSTEHRSVEDVPLRSVRGFVEDAHGRMWCATEQGVVRFATDGAGARVGGEELGDRSVHCLEIDRQGRVWAGSGNGLVCLAGDSVRSFRPGNDFATNNIGFLLCDQEGMLWAGSNNGIWYFHPDSSELEPDRITRSDGLLGTEANLNAKFCDAQGRLYFGTNGGLAVHDPSLARNGGGLRRPGTFLLELRSFLLPTDWSNACDSIDARSGMPIGLDLSYQRNHLTFDFTAVGLNKGNHMRFKYRLLGFDPDWSPPGNGRSATYSNLPHGEYVFEVRAAEHAGEWGAVSEFAFRIRPPFWLRWWFFMLCGLLAGAVVMAIQAAFHARRARHEKARQLALRSRMLQLEQQALNANMNRHFIFNALNSIQYYINRQDRTAANHYLAGFAKLIRKNLDASTSDTTTLREELQRLELYLMLEQMRFGEKFSYRIEVASAVDAERVELPAMMLQPYVENSIWHGILPSGRAGTVWVRVEPLGQSGVRVSVVDDGVGVDQSLATKRQGEDDHISRGIAITKGRADVLRKLALMEISITGPEQVLDDAGEPAGTRVLIDLVKKDLQEAPARTMFE